MDLKQAKAQDVILNHMNKEGGNSVWDISELHKNLSIDYDLCHVACEYIAYSREHAKIIDGRPTTSFPNDESIHILPEGRIFANSDSSYESEFLAAITKQENIQNEDRLKARKLKADVKNSEYLVKVQWWPIRISVTSLVIVVISTVINHIPDTKEPKLDTKTLVNTTSLSSHPKTEDSIYRESLPVESHTILENDSTKID